MSAQPSALIGHTGFVGSNLCLQRGFDAAFNSSNSETMRGRGFGRVVCAGISAVKWWANQNPDEDWRRIQALMAVLETVTAECFTLISTVDVYGRPIGATEADAVSYEGLHPYGAHRARFEDFVRTHFPRHHIVRLPALFGPGLKKNALYDLLHDNRLEAINPLGSFQWYPLPRLADDLDHIEAAGIDIVNMATEPVAMETIRAQFFPAKAFGPAADGAGRYDMRTLHDTLFGGAGGYMMTRAAVLDSIGAFIRAEQA